MNRRDLLKALGAVPIAGVLESCGNAYSGPPAPQGKEPQSERAHTLQVMLEGVFAVVLQKQAHRLTAFVPLADPKRTDLAHKFCFNDPGKPRGLKESEKGFRFELGAEGLHSYPEVAPYVNPGYNDFTAEVKTWHLPPSLVVLDLPFPRSINFSGRPLHVRFGKRALKPTGLMPTNYILEYRIDDESKIHLRCDHPDVNCSPSPHCPPGVMRYYFAAAPEMKDAAGRQKHAVEFFNFMMSRVFPEIAPKYEVVEIEPSDYPEPGETGGRGYPTSLHTSPSEEKSLLAPAVLRSGAARPRLLPVASLVDCQAGGFLGSSGSRPAGGG